MSESAKIMSRRVFILTLVICALTWSTFALAQESAKEATRSATGSAVIDEGKIKALKEKLATKVAELRQNQTRGFYGEIAALTKTSFTLVTTTGEIKVRFGDDTVVYKLGDKRADAKITDVKNTLTSSALGVYEPDTKTLTAKIILLESLPKYFSGEATAVDKTAGTIHIKSAKGETHIIDYEKTTTAQEYDTVEGKIKKSGLSRMSVGDQIQVWGSISEDDNQHILAERLLRIPREIFGAQAPIASPVPSQTAKASTKPSPSPKPTPSPTPKASPKSSPKASAAT